MKRLTAILVAGLFVLAPLSASAMEMMSDSSMKDVTGQAGVSIAIDDVVLEQWVGDTSYIDIDGTDGTQGAVVISGQHTLQDFQAITAETDGALESPGVGLTETGTDGVDRMAVTNPLTGAFIGTGATEGFQAYPLSIDVGTCSVLSAGLSYNTGLDVTVGGVVIGLPTLEVNSEDVDPQIISIEQSGAVNNEFELIRISQGPSTMHVLGGTVEIAPH